MPEVAKEMSQKNVELREIQPRGRGVNPAALSMRRKSPGSRFEYKRSFLLIGTYFLHFCLYFRLIRMFVQNMPDYYYSLIYYIFIIGATVSVCVLVFFPPQIYVQCFSFSTQFI